MARGNSYAGICYRCGALCAPGRGCVQRDRGRWLVVHHECAEKAKAARAVAAEKKSSSGT